MYAQTFKRNGCIIHVVDTEWITTRFKAKNDEHLQRILQIHTLVPDTTGLYYFNGGSCDDRIACILYAIGEVYDYSSTNDQCFINTFHSLIRYHVCLDMGFDLWRVYNNAAHCM